jgi:serine/threonine protein kinase
MHYAALNGEKKLIKYLFTKFTNANIKNEDGKTPLDILKEQKINIEDLENLEGLGISKSLYSKSSDSIEVISEIAPSFSFRDFEAIQILGRGSFGEVFLVEMRSNGQKFAIKVLRKDKIVGQNLVKYAMAERNVLSYIHHPFIVGLNFAFQSTEKLYLVLDYCPGGNLTSYIIRQRFFSESIAKFYLCELVLALEELHRHGIIYRDLKPDNVVIDSEGHALLTDFGLSKEGIIDNVSAKSFCGSVAYLAPEILKRKGHGKAVDWYLLGVLFYEMLVGVPPFYSNSKEQLFFNIEFKKPLIPSRISPSAESLLRKLLKKVPEKRIGFKLGAEEIKNHEFFHDVDWEIVLRKDITPPLKPIVMMVPGYIPRNHMMEDLSAEPDTRHLNGWTFINSA